MRPASFLAPSLALLLALTGACGGDAGEPETATTSATGQTATSPSTPSEIPAPVERCPRNERRGRARITVFAGPEGSCLAEDVLLGVRCPGPSPAPAFLSGPGEGSAGLTYLGGSPWAIATEARGHLRAVGPGTLRIDRRGDLLFVRQGGRTRRLLAMPSPPLAGDRPPRAVFIGDSVLLGARTALGSSLRAWRPRFHTGVSQTTYTGLRLTKELRGRSGYVAVVELGTNESNAGGFRERATRMLDRMSGADAVLWLTVRSPKSYAPGINAAIRSAVAGAPNAVLVDWEREAPRGGLTPDGVHLTPTGVRAMTRIVGETLEAWHRAARGEGPLACTGTLAPNA